MPKTIFGTLSLIIVAVTTAVRLDIDKVLVSENSPLGDLLKNLRVFALKEVGKIPEVSLANSAGASLKMVEKPNNLADKEDPEYSSEELEALKKGQDPFSEDPEDLKDDLDQQRLLSNSSEEVTQDPQYLTDDDAETFNDESDSYTDAEEEPEYLQEEEKQTTFRTKVDTMQSEHNNVSEQSGNDTTINELRNLTGNLYNVTDKHGSSTIFPAERITLRARTKKKDGLVKKGSDRLNKLLDPASAVIVSGSPCNRLDKSINCTLSDIRRYGCCPLQQNNPSMHKCNMSRKNDCPPHFKCVLHDEKLPYTVRGARVMLDEEWSTCEMISPYQNATLHSLSSRKFPRLGHPCSKELYEARMEPIWEKYLKCPWDPEPHELFEKLKRDWLVNHDIMDQVCFSPFIEACGAKNTCECFSKVLKNDDGHVAVDFRQVKQGDHCGLLSKGQCAHSIRGAEFKHCGHILRILSNFVPDPYHCEVDAVCE